MNLLFNSPSCSGSAYKKKKEGHNPLKEKKQSTAKHSSSEHFQPGEDQKPSSIEETSKGNLFEFTFTQNPNFYSSYRSHGCRSKNGSKKTSLFRRMYYPVNMCVCVRVARRCFLIGERDRVNKTHLCSLEHKKLELALKRGEMTAEQSLKNVHADMGIYIFLTQEIPARFRYLNSSTESPKPGQNWYHF